MLEGADRTRLLPRRRPSRAEIEPAALALLQRHGSAIMAAARRFAATPEDAEDAYQRGVEIMLTRAPTTAEDELVPWLRTVVKHEAWALHRQRQRAAPVADDGRVPEGLSEDGLTHEQAERLERLRLGAEAIAQMKPQEVRALLLRAEGYSYSQIQDITGWTYTKVNRCLSEGRRAFVERVAGIEGGSECGRLSPLLSKLVDGEAAADDLRTLRPHLRTCLSCRAALREYRGAPAAAAALVPAAALAAPGRLLDPPAALLDVPARLLEARGRLLDAVAGWTQRAHAAVEMASAQKVAALAASTAVLAGGGAATVSRVERDPAQLERAARVERRAVSANTRAAADIAAVKMPTVAAAPRPAPSAAELRRAREQARARRAAALARSVERRTPPAHQEFEPAWAAGAPAPDAAPVAAASAAGASTPSADPPQRSSRAGAGAEEFAP
jgi:RNA polymerase sigma factor (sigma-70 family)